MNPDSSEPKVTVVHVSQRTLGSVGSALVAATWMGLGGLAVLTLAGRADLAAPAWLIVPVTLLPYLYGGVALWCFALWSAAPDRNSPPIQLTLVCVTALGLWGPSWAARGESAVAGEPVRVMTWNLRRLWGGPTDGGDARTCAVQTIQAAQPDVLALQEVSAEDVNWLADSLDLDCVHATYLAGGGPTKGGLAACSRGERWRRAAGGGQRFVDPKDWHYVFAEFRTGTRVFNLLSVHLHPYELSMGRWMDLGRRGELVQQAQSDQSAALLARMSRLEDPTVVAGDFNSTRDSALHVALRKHLTDAWERGGLGFGGTVHLLGVAPLRVDYTYASDALAVQASEVVHAGCSDHLPVVSDLTVR